MIFLNAGDEFAFESALTEAVQQMRAAEDCDIGFFSTQVVMENGVHYTRPAKSPGYIEYGQPAIHQSTIMRRERHARWPYDFDTYPNIADYVAVANMIKSGGGAASFGTVLAKFEVTRQSSSFVNQRAVRQEFDTAIQRLWMPSTTKLLHFRLRRRLAMLAVWFLMKLRRTA